MATIAQSKKMIRAWGAWLTVIVFFSVPMLVFAQYDVDGISGVTFQRQSNAVLLRWPSDKRESFAVLWRANARSETKWITLTNLLRGSQSTNSTVFRHTVYNQPGNLSDLYRVFVVPDFWFDFNGSRLDGTRNFLPFYYGKRAVGYETPLIYLLVDGANSEDYERTIQEVNFGSVKQPRWLPSDGIWFSNELLKNGPHTLQIKSTVPLNYLVEEGQFVTLTNRPVRILITNGNNVSSLRNQFKVRRPNYAGTNALEERLRTRPLKP